MDFRKSVNIKNDVANIKNNNKNNFNPIISKFSTKMLLLLNKNIVQFSDKRRKILIQWINLINTMILNDQYKLRPLICPDQSFIPYMAGFISKTKEQRDHIYKFLLKLKKFLLLYGRSTSRSFKEK